MFRPFVFVCSIIFCFALEGFGQAVIAQQDFEASPASPTMTFTNSGGGFSSGNIGPTGKPANANLFASGARGWQSTSLGTGVSSIEFANVQISDYVSKYLTFRFGTFDDVFNGGMDYFYDRFEVFVSLDNGQSYSNELRCSTITDNNAYGFATSSTDPVSYDGDNNPAAVIFAPGSPRGLLRINLPDNATQVKIRIAFQCASPETVERWVIDDVKIMGTPNSVSIGTISTSPICVGPSNPATATVGYTLVGMFGASNDLTAWLSDAFGSFVSETLIGTLEDINSNGSINITIPGNTPSGTGYKIRIKSNQPVSTSNETAAFQIVNGVFNVGSPSATNWHEKSAVNWVNPAYCFDEIMIVAKAGSPVSATPAGDGTGYSHNLNFGSGDIFDGGYVVYKGSTSPQIIRNLLNDVTYHITFFTRKGTLWS